MGKDNLVYHYCSLDTFKKIIENHTLRFSDITKSNDTEELFFITNLYHKYYNLKNNLNETFNASKFFLEQSNLILKTYAFCLTYNIDDLSQWRGYAQNGGFAIGFDKEELKEYTNKIEFLNMSDSEEFAKGLKDIKYLNIENVTFSELHEIFKDMHNYNYFKFLLKNSPNYKNDGFIFEKEIRMYFQFFIENEVKGVSSVLFNGHKIEGNDNYYDVPFSFSMIKDIIIGPKVDCLDSDFANKTIVYNYLKSNDKKNELILDENDICNTKLTYR